MLVLKDGLNFKNPTICCLQYLHLKYEDTERLTVKGWKETFHTITNQRKAVISMLVLEKKSITKDIEGDSFLIKILSNRKT